MSEIVVCVVTGEIVTTEFDREGTNGPFKAILNKVPVWVEMKKVAFPLVYWGKSGPDFQIKDQIEVEVDVGEYQGKQQLTIVKSGTKPKHYKLISRLPGGPDKIVADLPAAAENVQSNQILSQAQVAPLIKAAIRKAIRYLEELLHNPYAIHDKIKDEIRWYEEILDNYREYVK